MLIKCMGQVLGGWRTFCAAKCPPPPFQAEKLPTVSKEWVSTCYHTHQQTIADRQFKLKPQKLCVYYTCIIIWLHVNYGDQDVINRRWHFPVQTGPRADISRPEVSSVSIWSVFSYISCNVKPQTPNIVEGRRFSWKLKLNLETSH